MPELARAVDEHVLVRCCGLNKDLGFTPEDRAENVRRIAETARLLFDAGLIAIVALVSPFRADRAAARSLFEPG